MIEPTEADIGRKVIYTPAGDYPGKESEEGVLTSFNEHYAFVRFGAGDTAAACNPYSLRWAQP